jgi:AraC-like DNA-binding protein
MGGDWMNRIQSEMNFSIKLERLGHTLTDPFWVETEHKHDDFELLYILKGPISVSSHQDEITLQQGELIIIPPHEVHRIITDDASAFLSIGFDTNLSINSLSCLTPVSKEENEEIFTLTTLLEDMVEQAFAQNTDFTSYGIQVMAKLTSALCSICTPSSDTDQKRILSDKIKTYIHKHAHEPIRVEEIAEIFHYSPHTLGNVFSTVNGMTIKEYVLQHKMEKAVILLSQRKQSISEIARLLGYESPNYFSKCFKNYYGFSPTKLHSKEEPQ